ncbi:MAG: NADH-quinone oxidoreductase subunit L [Bacteroidetes bacterium]|nr:MAG: NADH-quinone oxidoreductase subunit L [Bacteroidota bacterium]
MDAALLVQLILLLPLAGAVFNGILPLFLPALRTREPLIGAVATAVVAIPFVLVLILFLGYEPGQLVIVDFFPWIVAGDLEVHFAYRIDELSLVMGLIVTGVGALIHLYAVGYMHGDSGFWRFFAYLNLFIFAMLNLVLGDNMVVLFLGWEGVGVCSYLLIGFWYTNLKNSAAANKAFIVNRIGDFAFLVAMFLLFRELGGLDFTTITEGGGAIPEATLNWIVLLLFIGATGKSAQIPLFVWLPDAMAGPTPVSALIHAATMVTSGLYLLARLSPVVLAAPDIMVVIAVVAALTAIMAASIAIAQNDIKKVLAYSTVSQLVYMFMATGVGAFFVAIFHVMTHAFFKACLFLGSGSVIHAMHHVEHEVEHKTGKHIDPQDMRTMGGLKKYMPATSRTYFIAMLAIAGIPPLAGFFSKDEILFKAFEYGYDGHAYAWFVWIVGLLTAVLTAFYMARSYYLTFEGEERWPLADQVHPHESPWTMTVPLWVLAGLSVVGGFLGLPGVIAHGEWNLIHHWLGEPYGGPVAEPVLAPHGEGFLAIEWGLILLGAGIAFAGWLFARAKYRTDGLAYDAHLRAKLGGLYRAWEGKYYWDELYDRLVVQPLMRFSERGLAAFDRYVVDGAVNGVAALTAGISRGLRYVQTGIVQNYALAIVFGAILVISLILFA